MSNNCLQSINPELSKEWHPVKNGSLTPMDVTTGTHKKVWWICSKGHEWQARVNSRSGGNGCPCCARKVVCDDNCLQTLNPDLATEWHPTKNGSKTPRDVAVFTHKKVWWMCGKGHEWEATVAHRSSGRGCPICAGKVVNDDNCLQTLKPELAREWHPIKNGSLTPNKVHIYSNKNVWWKCKKGHEWPAKIADRSRGNSCPFCMGRLVNDDNSLQTLNPELAAEWHPIKNSTLTPKNVTVQSNKKVWWICKRGHEWEAAIYSRSRGNGCPNCGSSISRLQLRIYSEIKYLFKDVKLREKIDGMECDIYIPEYKVSIELDGFYWHRNKFVQDRGKAVALRKKGIIPINVRETGLKKVSDSDIFYSPDDSDLSIIKRIIRTINRRINLSDLVKMVINEYLKRDTIANDSEYKELWDMRPFPPLDLSLLECNPYLALEWHPIRNGNLKPRDVTPGSEMKVWWMCSSGHEWEATVNHRSNGRDCPCCAGKMVCDDNCLQTLNPELAKEWHPTKNGSMTPRDVVPFSHKKAWWICSKGHPWEAIIANRSKGRGCPVCAGKVVSDDNCLQTIYPALAKEWHPTKNGNLTPRTVTTGTHKKVWWICTKGHEWQAVVSDRSRGRGCPYCSHHKHA